MSTKTIQKLLIAQLLLAVVTFISSHYRWVLYTDFASFAWQSDGELIDSKVLSPFTMTSTRIKLSSDSIDSRQPESPAVKGSILPHYFLTALIILQIILLYYGYRKAPLKRQSDD